jgi:flagellar biosynthesis protein FlhF
MIAPARNTAQLLAFPGQSLRANLTPVFKQHRLPEALGEALIREASTAPVRALDTALTHALAARMRLAPIDLGKTGRIFLVGPSGAGRSTVAAKLAHAAALAGRADLTIIEADGFNPRNPRARAAFACLDERDGVETIGVVSALGDAEEISEIVAAFRLGRIVVTGLDMASRLGALVAAATQGAALAHVTRSPKADVPLEDLTARALANLLLN